MKLDKLFEGIEFVDLVLDLSQSRSLYSGYLDRVEIYIGYRDQVWLEFVPES